jgi:general secretion pathway protein G
MARTAAQQRASRSGFSLIEIVAVLAVLGMTAGLVTVNWRRGCDACARKQASRIAKADITVMMSALDEFAMNNAGKYPDSLEVLVTPDENGHTYLKGPADKLFKDPWKNEYVYEAPQSGQPRPRILSYGKDGQPGGEGDDRDIASDDSEG